MKARIRKSIKCGNTLIFLSFLKQVEESCTEEQKELIMDRLFSLSASNREDVLEWCKFLKSSGGGEWKNEFIYRINRYKDFLRSVRRCMKMKVGVVYNAILPEGRTKVDSIDCDALESDDTLAALLVLVEILKFAIEVDEWLLAVIVLEHFNKTELREFVVHMFQPE